MSMWRYSFIFISVIAAAFLQTTDLFLVGGVKPNLTLSFLIALSYAIPSPFFFAAATAGALTVLSRGIRIEHDALVMGLVALLGFLGGGRLPGKPFLNTMSMAFAGTFLVYALGDARFLGGHPVPVLAEAAVNSITALVVFVISSRAMRTHHEAKTRTAG